MKVILTVIIFGVVSFFYPIHTSAQIFYSKFFNFNDSLSIYCSCENLDDLDDYILHIGFNTDDPLVSEVGIMISTEGRKAFIDAFRIAEAKYNEWRKIAIDNNVKRVDKDIELPFELQAPAYFVSSGEGFIDILTTFNLSFRVNPEGQDVDGYWLTITSDKLVDMNNQFITAGPIFLAFDNVQDISNFTDLISPKKVIEFKLKPKVTDLFKN